LDRIYRIFHDEQERILSILKNTENLVIKNVAQGRFEYSHSPDNRALTKPYPVTTYLVAN